MRMHTPLTAFFTAASVLAVAFCLAGSVPAEKYSVAELKDTPPDQLAAEIRDTLSKTGYRVSNSGGKTICDVWFRAELPIIQNFQPQLEVMYAIEPGTLVGAIHFPAVHADYRNHKIKPGAYTLRFGLQPQDGNHIGTAQYRDFLMPVQAAEDTSVATIPQEKAEELSAKATKTKHPLILSLLPPQQGRDKLPTMYHFQEDDLDLDVLVVKISTPKGAAVKELQIEMVTVGHGPE